MRQVVALSICCLCLSAPGCRSESSYNPVAGDIVFQTSRSSQSAAIQLATKSPYSHMGIVYIQDGRPFVFEAVEPVKLTPFPEWAARGEKGEFVAKRIIDASRILTTEALERLQAVGEGFEGRHYDLYFEWSDDRIYCSELVWKVFKRGLGIEIGKLEKLGDFDLSSRAVREKLLERWPGSPPLTETVISPAAMFDSDQLIEVYRGRVP